MTKKQSSNAIGKVCAILRVLSHQNNLRLSDIADETGFNRVTTLRILDELAEQNFVSRRSKPPRYSLGPEAIAMSSAPSLATEIRASAQESIQRITGFCKDTVLLSLRTGTESVVIDRAVGTFPIQANFLHVGDRRPLGIGAGSMALLAFLPKSERTSVLNVTLGRIEKYPRINRDVLEQHIATSEANGYVKMLDIVIDRIGGIGVPIRLPEVGVVASFSVAALSERIIERENELAQLMIEEARIVVNKLKAQVK